MAVAVVDIQVGASGALQQLKAIRQASMGAADGFNKLNERARAVKAIVEAQQGSFAKASTVQGVFAAKVKNTETAIRAQISALRDVQSKVQIGGALYQRAAKQIAEYEQVLRKANGATEQSGRSFDAIQSGLAALGVGAALFNAQNIARSFIDAANAADAAQRRIKLVSQGFDDYRSVLEVSESAASRFGLSQTQAASAIADIYTRLRPVGFQLNEINAIYEGFNTAVKLSGVSADAASAAFLQLSQGLGSGTLQGDELRSVLEQMPAIAQAIAKEMNINVGSIKEFGSKGKITSDIIVRALDRVRTEGAAKLAEALDTPQQRIIDLQNAFEEFQVTVGSTVAPLVIGSIKDITNAVKETTQFVEDLKLGFELLGGAAGGLGNIEIGLGGINKKLSEIGANKALYTLIDFLLLGGPSILGAVSGAGQRRRGRQGYNAPAGPEMPVRLSMQGRDFGGGAGRAGRTGRTGRTGSSAADAAAKEAERVAELIRLRSAEGQFIQLKSELQDKISAAEAAEDKLLVTRLQGQQRELDIQFQYAQELAKEKDIRAQQAIIYKGQNELVANQRDVQRELSELQNQSARDQIAAMGQIIGKQYELNQLQQKQKELADGIANTVGQGLTSAFDALIRGSQDFGSSLRQIASGVLIDIANQLLQVFVIQKAINAISGLFGPKGGGGLSYAGVSGNALGTSMISGGFNAVPFSTAGLGFRANGGSVTSGRPYVVGERGPELFMPGRSGGIAPTGSFGGGVNVVVNVDASGSSVQGDQSQAKALGGAISAAVQAEIVKQQRPGGLLAGTR